MILHSGTVLMFRYGRYYDPVDVGPFTVLRSFDQREAARLYCAEHRKTAKDDYDEPKHDGFIAWLAKNRYIEEIPTTWWQLGEYSFEPLIDGEDVGVDELLGVGRP